MIKKIASILSVIFHPLFLFFYLILYLVYFTDIFLIYRYSSHLWMFLLYVFLNTILIPLILILFYTRDLMMKDKENRTIPYVILIVVYCFMLFFFLKFYISALILRFLIGLIIGLLCLTIVNKYYKLSLHTFGMGTLLSFFIRIYFLQPTMIYYSLMGVILLAGIIGSARLILEAHSKEELLAGFGIGSGITLLALIF
jgi:hypothetical protein